MNCISETFIWPDLWKIEIVTVIPKSSNPQSYDLLRNISCMLLVSKIYESYLLAWSQEEVRTRNNQYGGVKGCCAEYLLPD